MPTNGCLLGMPEEDPIRMRSPTAVRLFSLYLRWYFARNFHAVRITRSGILKVPSGRPIIVYSNHPSWWDPAMFVLLMDSLMPGRIGFGPMDATALQRYGVLRKVGVFGINPESHAGASHFLHTGLRILGDLNSVLWVAAEGAFTDPRVRPVHLRAGVAHLARRVPEAVVLPLALEYPFWNERRPEALAHFGPALDIGIASNVAEWTSALEASLTRTMDALAAKSMTRDPALFVTLLRGQAGVGGVYDLWRYGAALVAGRRFYPGHEVEE